MAHPNTLDRSQSLRLMSGQSNSELAFDDVWGFDSHVVSLYAHREVLNADGVVMKAAGSVVEKYHVQDPDNLMEHEKDHLGRRAEINGWFSWEPGDGCFTHKWTTITRGEQGQKVRGASVMGCKWCRERQTTTKPEAVVEAGLTSSPVSAPPPVTELVCATCGYSPPVIRSQGKKKGKKYAPSQRKAHFNGHLQTHQAA